MLRISAIYDAKHARLNVGAEKTFSESNFVRKSLKFWVKLSVRTELLFAGALTLCDT